MRVAAARSRSRAGAPPGGSLLLAIDVGNTQTVLGVLEGSRVCELFRVSSGLPRTGDELLPVVERLIAPWGDGLAASGRAVIGSVVPSLTPAWEQLARRLLGRDPHVASAASAHGLRLELKDPASVGADRIANAVAVAALYRLPAIVVDLGTATTFDVVVPGPRYLGGAIAPGILTSAEELFRRAARLAKVDLRPPEHVVGRTTEEAIQSGVYFGSVGQIDGLVTRLGAELGERPFVIATGGLASVIAAGSSTIERVDPTLTLQGLRLIEERDREARGG